MYHIDYSVRDLLTEPDKIRDKTQGYSYVKVHLQILGRARGATSGGGVESGYTFTDHVLKRLLLWSFSMLHTAHCTLCLTVPS